MVYVLYAVRVGWLGRRVVALKRAVCAQPCAGMLGQGRAGFSGQRVGSRPSFFVLGSWRAVAELNVTLWRFLLVGKTHAGLALTGQVVGCLLVGDRWMHSLAVVSL
jgi:hypothetical protein